MENTATTSAHTPGPWDVRPDLDLYGTFSVYEILSQCEDLIDAAERGHDQEKAIETAAAIIDANARLIAAAPRLVDALARLLDVFLDGRMEELMDKEADAYREAEAALAEAYGNAA